MEIGVYTSGDGAAHQRTGEMISPEQRLSNLIEEVFQQYATLDLLSRG